MAEIIAPKRRAKAAEAAPAANGSHAAAPAGLSKREVAYHALQQEIAERLVMLRAEFREAVANYSVNVQGLLAQLADALREEDSAELPSAERKVRVRALRQAIDELNALDLKPDKGRRRDLKRVEGFAVGLSDTIAEW